MEKSFDMSIRTYYGTDNNNHRRIMKLSEIKKWIEAYKFTHPDVTAISIKIWFKDEEK